LSGRPKILNQILAVIPPNSACSLFVYGYKFNSFDTCVRNIAVDHLIFVSRLREISEESSTQQQPRKRSNSLPIPKIEVSLYQSPELKKQESKDFMEVPEVKDVSYLTGNILSLEEMFVMYVCMYQWRTEGGFGVLNPPPLRNSKGPPKSCQIQPDCENC